LEDLIFAGLVFTHCFYLLFAPQHSRKLLLSLCIQSTANGSLYEVAELLDRPYLSAPSAIDIIRLS